MEDEQEQLTKRVDRVRKKVKYTHLLPAMHWGASGTVELITFKQDSKALHPFCCSRCQYAKCS